MSTVPPRYNEVPRDGTIYFVLTGVCNKRNPDITKLLKKYEKTLLSRDFDNRKNIGDGTYICWGILISFITW